MRTLSPVTSAGLISFRYSENWELRSKNEKALALRSSCSDRSECTIGPTQGRTPTKELWLIFEDG